MQNDHLVELPGHGRFWFLEDDGEGALAPLEHCTATGRIRDLATALVGQSYAHVCPDGTIKRFNEVIGRRDDLLPVD